MIKSMIAIPLDGDVPDLDSINAALAGNEFHPCSGQEVKKSGWRRHAGGDFARKLGGKVVMKHVTEKRSVPASVVKVELKREIAKYIEQNGEEPSKSDTKLMKEEIVSKLLSRAFPKQTEALVWVDGNWIFIEAGNRSKAEDIFVELINTTNGDFPGSKIVDASASSLMTDWIMNNAPSDFSVDDRCELVLPQENKPTVKYVNHNLEGEDVIQHLKGGKVPVSLGLTFDNKVSFVLADGFVIKSIKFLEAVDAEVADDELDADGEFILMSGYLKAANDGLMAQFDQAA